MANDEFIRALGAQICTWKSRENSATKPPMTVNVPLAVGGSAVYQNSPYSKSSDHNTLWTTQSTDVPILIRGFKQGEGFYLEQTDLGQEEHADFRGTCASDHGIGVDDRIIGEDSKEYKVVKSYLNANSQFRVLHLRWLP